MEETTGWAYTLPRCKTLALKWGLGIYSLVGLYSEFTVRAKVTWGLHPHFRLLHSQSMQNIHVDAGLTRPGLCVDNQTVQPTCATSWHGDPGISRRRDAVPPGKATAIMIATHCEA